MISSVIMCTARKFGSSKGACFAIVVWLATLLFVSHVISRDTKAHLVTLKHLSRNAGQLFFLRKKNAELLSLLDKCYFGRIQKPVRKILPPRRNVVNSNQINHLLSEAVKHNPVAPLINFEPTVEYEVLRRKLYSGVQDFWWFISSEVKRIIKERKKSILNFDEIFKNLLNLGAEHKRTILKDVSTINVLDGHDNWRLQELNTLSNLIQLRLEKLQNPADCYRTNKFTCSLVKTCCYACLLHHLTYCLIVAFGHGRTLVIKQDEKQHGISKWESIFQPISRTCLYSNNFNSGFREDPSQPRMLDLPPINMRPEQPYFLPGTIPKDFAARLVRSHGNPDVWWIGQFLKYLMKYQPDLENTLNKFGNASDFDYPIVGVHIHRPTRFDSVGKYHTVEEYMIEVEDYYMQLNLSSLVSRKTIYLATNDDRLFGEIQEKYPEYDILGNGNFSLFTAQENQCNKFALNAVLTNVHFLARTDYLVCAFSSEVCRLAYEIMNWLVPDAYNRFRSLDRDYYFEGQVAEHHIVTQSHSAKNPNELTLSKGTMLVHEENLWNGYSRASLIGEPLKSGIYPSFKAVKIVNVVDYLAFHPHYLYRQKLSRSGLTPTVPLSPLMHHHSQPVVDDPVN